MLSQFLCTVFALMVLVSQVRAGTIHTDVLKPYVEVRTERGRPCGSGTFIKVDDEILVLTAAHVVADQVSDPDDLDAAGDVFLFKLEWGEERPARVVFYDPPEEEGGRDMALVRPYKPVRQHAALGLDAKLEEGEDVWYVGTPNGVHQSLEKSIINRIGVLGPGDFPFYLVNGNAWYGNSGGGVYVKRNGAYVLAGVLTRGWGANNPKCPGGVEPPEAIRAFLAGCHGSGRPAGGEGRGAHIRLLAGTGPADTPVAGTCGSPGRLRLLVEADPAFLAAGVFLLVFFGLGNFIVILTVQGKGYLHYLYDTDPGEGY